MYENKICCDYVQWQGDFLQNCFKNGVKNIGCFVFVVFYVGNDDEDQVGNEVDQLDEDIDIDYQVDDCLVIIVGQL